MRKYFLFFTVFITGGSVMILEVIGSRILGPYYGVSLYIWSALITITLIALSVGYWFGGIVADKLKKAGGLYAIIFFSGIVTSIIPLFSSPILLFTRSLGLKLGALTSAFLIFSLKQNLLNNLYFEF